MNKKTLLTLVGLLAINGSMLAQSFTMSRKNITVAQAMAELKQKTGYAFLYESSDLNTTRRVNVNAKNLNDAVSQIVKGQDVDYDIQGHNIVISKKQQNRHKVSQGSTKRSEGNRVVRGTITDQNGEPVIGATIQMKGNSSVGTVSDLDGHFTLDVPAGAELVVSYIGYGSQTVRANDNVRIALREDRKSLDEVVVVGYGTQKKVSVTGAIATTKGSDLAAVPTTNLTNTLAGRLPGLVSYNRSGEPGYDDAGLLIRGASTIGDSSPLLVVDGVADRAGSLGRIDANDIESISILKDASAAIYGSRAANGVILVTTKRGSNERIKINYNGNVGLSRPTILPKMCDSWEYAQLINEITPGTYTDEQIQKFRDGSDPLNYPNVKAFDTLLRNAVETQHNVSASGGGKI